MIGFSFSGIRSKRTCASCTDFQTPVCYRPCREALNFNGVMISQDSNKNMEAVKFHGVVKRRNHRGKPTVYCKCSKSLFMSLCLASNQVQSFKLVGSPGLLLDFQLFFGLSNFLFFFYLTFRVTVFCFLFFMPRTPFC